MVDSKLIERIEGASGGSRELDDEIAFAVSAMGERVPCGHTFNRITGHKSGIAARHYTTSIDAAMTLVPEGWRVSKLEQHWRTGRWIAQLSERPTEGQLKAFDDGKTIGWNTADTSPDAATPALALVVAALRSRSSS